MKLPSLTSLFPATAIAIGVSAIASQPSQAADYSYETYSNYDDWSYSADRIQLPDLDRAYRRDAPAYHYAYYSIARPEYLL
ncbi:MAG: hypothetical protein NW224_16630 [Leptolyngbyaceae cyanobacterium bins.302]|nr:hypothetical protein [Leptolyngbyaceae cyanobacterium bins.302]